MGYKQRLVFIVIHEGQVLFLFIFSLNYSITTLLFESNLDLFCNFFLPSKVDFVFFLSIAHSSSRYVPNMIGCCLCCCTPLYASVSTESTHFTSSSTMYPTLCFDTAAAGLHVFWQFIYLAPFLGVLPLVRFGWIHNTQQHWMVHASARACKFRKRFSYLWHNTSHRSRWNPTLSGQVPQPHNPRLRFSMSLVDDIWAEL